MPDSTVQRNPPRKVALNLLSTVVFVAGIAVFAPETASAWVAENQTLAAVTAVGAVVTVLYGDVGDAP